MAYLLNINHLCLIPSCKKEARVKLFNTANSEMGTFCRPHGTLKLKEQKKLEHSYVEAG